MRPLSESTARVASRNFSRKYIALGRLVNEWEDIMGKDFSNKAQPLKINYRKAPKGQKAKASLDIATSASNATLLSYQKDLIIERMNRIFGDTWITDIRFVVSELPEDPPAKRIMPKPLSGGEKKILSNMLDQIEDQDIKDRLEKLGKAILTDDKK
ncbi:MAG: DUF721 domain-containing protein [Alphaproteobacteria bacterium]